MVHHYRNIDLLFSASVQISMTHLTHREKADILHIFFSEIWTEVIYSLAFCSQMYLNYLGNYVPNAWNYENGCSGCDDDLLDLTQLEVCAFFLSHYLALWSLKFCPGKSSTWDNSIL